MYGRSRKSLFRRTGPIICTTSGIRVSGCTEVVEVPLAPPGEEVKLEANRTAATEIRPGASMMCNAEARTELSRFFFILFFRWSSGSKAASVPGPPQASQMLLTFLRASSDGVLRSGLPFIGKRAQPCQTPLLIRFPATQKEWSNVYQLRLFPELDVPIASGQNLSG